MTFRIPAGLFIEINKLILEKQRNENGQTILEKNMFLTYKKMLKIIIH